MDDTPGEHIVTVFLIKATVIQKPPKTIKKYVCRISYRFDNIRGSRKGMHRKANWVERLLRSLKRWGGVEVMMITMVGW